MDAELESETTAKRRWYRCMREVRVNHSKTRDRTEVGDVLASY
jgi:hypothetical protein